MTPIEVDRRLSREIRESPTGFTVQIQDAPDPELAAEALRRAVAEIRELDAGWESAPNLGPGDRNNPAYVSDVVVVPSGPFIYVDGGHVPYAVLSRAPGIVGECLREAGIERARITTPEESDPLEDHEWGAYLVSVNVRPPWPPLLSGEPAIFPPRWFEVARRWLAAGEPADDLVWVTIGLSFQIPVDQVPHVHNMWRTEQIVHLRMGTVSDAIWRQVDAHPGREPNMRFSASGPGLQSVEQARELFEENREIARAVAPEADYVSAGVSPRRPSEAHEYDPHRREARRLIHRVGDEAVWDVGPYQILGPGHIGRLGGSPEGAVALANGRWEFELGPLEDWLLDPERPDEGPNDPRVVRWREHYDRGRKLLRKCLITPRKARRIYDRRVKELNAQR